MKSNPLVFVLISTIVAKIKETLKNIQFFV